MLRNFFLTVVTIFYGALSVFASGPADSTGFLISDSTRSSVNLFMETVKVVSALIIILILIVFVLWVLKYVLRLKGVTGITGGAIRVLEIQHIDPKKSIALVRIMDRVLIIGWTENMISGLGELSADEISRLNIKEPEDTKGFGTILSRFTGKDSSDKTDSNKEKYHQ